MPRKIITGKLVFCTLLVLLPIWLLSAVGYFQLRQSFEEQLSHSLSATLNSTQHALLDWKTKLQENLTHLKKDHRLTELVAQLAQIEHLPTPLTEHPAQTALRQHLTPLLVDHGYQGYFLIGPDNINLAASQENFIGRSNQLPLRGSFLQSAWNGSLFFSAPQPPARSWHSASGHTVMGSPSIFIGTPLRDPSGQIIAVLTFQIDPKKQFNPIFTHDHSELSGDTYALSLEGELLSQHLSKVTSSSQKKNETIQVVSYPLHLLQQLSSSRQAALHQPNKDAIGKPDLNLTPYLNYRGSSVVGGLLWDQTFNIGVITELDEQQAFEPLYLARHILLASLILTSLIIIGLAVGFQWVQQHMRRKQRELNRLFQNSSDALLLIDPYSQKPLSCNTKAELLLGYTQKELTKLNFHAIKEERFPGELEHNLKQLLIKKSAVFESRYIRHNGTRFPVEVSCQVMEYQNASVLLLSVRDISERKALEAQLKAQAQTDQLTLLPNRVALDEQVPLQMQEQKRQNQSLALIFIGLDEFSIINDTLGHRIGDQVFVKIAQRISETIPIGGHLYRFEGDVFVCSIPVEHTHNADQAAGNIARAFIQPLSVHGHLLHLTVSIGVALSPGDAQTLVELTRCAHSAMHASKDLGGSRWILFNEEMQAVYQRQMELKNALTNALKRGEFSLHYQPIVDAHSGKIVGAESLIRWEHPQLGNIRPDQFISIAEKSGHIIAIGAWIIDEACHTLAELRAKGHTDLRLSVNLSPVQLLAADILGTVKSALHYHGLPASALAIEITEGLFIDDTNAALETLVALHEYQIPLYMDDFGTGYSSLSYLTRFPFHTLKIDRSFVTNLEQRSKDRNLASSIIAMSEKLGLRVIAEGVETDWQKTFLEQNGCHYFQGYLFHKPMPKNALFDLLKQKPEHGRRPTLTAVPAK